MTTMYSTRCTLLPITALLLIIVMMTGCSTAPKTAADRAALHEAVLSTVAKFKASDPTLAEHFQNSRGYAVFPTVGKGAWVIGGAYGRGEVFENGEMIGYADITQGTIGFQFGGQAYSELIFFQTSGPLDELKAGALEFAAQMSAVAATAGAGANAKYTNGVMVFTAGEAGLMVEASVGGQKFDYLPKETFSD